eukprot:1128322-Amphidinium_carterae.1
MSSPVREPPKPWRHSLKTAAEQGDAISINVKTPGSESRLLALSKQNGTTCLNRGQTIPLADFQPLTQCRTMM